MKSMIWRSASFAAAALCLVATAQADGIKSAEDAAGAADFDIVETTVKIESDTAVFTSRVRGSAGATKPEATGKFEGAPVHAYVWPTSLNSSDVGFEKDQGIVALAATFHPDFDDAAKGGKNRDQWHAHWVVLGKDDACKGGSKSSTFRKTQSQKYLRLGPVFPC